MIRVQTERAANGTDGAHTESLVAMDVKTGEIFQPDLSVVLQNRLPYPLVTGRGYRVRMERLVRASMLACQASSAFFDVFPAKRSKGFPIIMAFVS
jgi:hypothetical protein